MIDMHQGKLKFDDRTGLYVETGEDPVLSIRLRKF